MLDISELFRANIGAKAIQVDTREELASEIDKFVSDFMKNHTNSIKRAFEKDAGGVIISARGIGLVNKPTVSWNWYTTYKQCPNLEIPYTGYALLWLTELIKQ
jgi:hypothetical protein